MCSMLALISACSDSEISPRHNSLLYQPLQIGAQRVYEVVKVKIDLPTNIRDTSVYLLKETILHKTADTLGYKLYIAQQDVRYADTLPWQRHQQISYRVHNRKIVRVEDNVPTTVLQFPESTQRTWNGNEYNKLPTEMFSYESLFGTFANNHISVDSVITVLQNKFESLYTFKHKQEQYAYGIGMCSKIDIDIESQPIHGPIDVSIPIKERITYGYVHRYTLISYSLPK